MNARWIVSNNKLFREIRHGDSHKPDDVEEYTINDIANVMNRLENSTTDIIEKKGR